LNVVELERAQARAPQTLRVYPHQTPPPPSLKDAVNHASDIADDGKPNDSFKT
jgi:hypothetical protein